MANDNSSPIDLGLAHRHFSAECFNQTWPLIDKLDRTEADDEAMILSATASLWHWMQRADCTDRNLSIGHWQVSRVYALLGKGENAMRHAKRSLALATGSSPFYVGYGHEAVARAAAVLADSATCQGHLKLALVCLKDVADASERAALENDLRTVAAQRPV